MLRKACRRIRVVVRDIYSTDIIYVLEDGNQEDGRETAVRDFIQLGKDKGK